jgi:hypothetical protein
MIGVVATTLVIGILAATCQVKVHLHLTYVWSACAAVDGEGGEGGRGVDSVTLLVVTLVVVAHVLQ